MIDMYLTEEARLNIWGMQMGLTLFTVKPIGKDVFYGPNGTYIEAEGKDFRAGIVYFKIGPFKFGPNNESIRDITQNGLHDILGDPRFKVMNRKPCWVWQIG